MMQTQSRGRLAKGAYSISIVLLVALILIAANFVASRVLARLDLTKDKEFTISNATKEVLRDLDDLVTIKVYFSEKLPPNLAMLRRNIDDMLREYQAYSKGKLRAEYIDPSADPEEEQKLRFLGIPQIQLNILEKDQLQVINGYMGIAILYADRHQSIPIVQDVYTLEYDLTAGILQVLQTEKGTIGFLTGNQEPELNREFEALNQLLSNTYDVRPVDLDQGRKEVPPEINTLLVVRSQSVPDRVKWQIDQFIMRGGRAVFLLDPMRLDDQMGLQNPIPVNSNLDDLLAHYGVRLERALVQDLRNENAGFTQGFVRYMVPYPMWPKIMGKDLSEDNPITSRLEALVLPWCSPLNLLVPEAGAEAVTDTTAASPEIAPQPDVTATVLARSSERAWLQRGRFDLTPPGPLQRTSPPQEGQQSFPLAAALVGSFRSFYEGQPPPLAPGDSLAIGGGETELVMSPETQVIVIGNSMFASSNFLSMFPGNHEFLLNTVDWMTLGDKLIAIRSRGATDRPLEIASATSKMIFKYANTFGMALLVAIFGIVRFSLRRRTRKAAEISYAA
jgi:gliding-associated putative ABC transporter substrate-binding component GldG